MAIIVVRFQKMIFKLFAAFLFLIFFSMVPLGWYSISVQEKLVQSYVQKTNDAFVRFIGFQVFTIIAKTKSVLDIYSRLGEIQDLDEDRASRTLIELVENDMLFTGAGIYSARKTLIAHTENFQPPANLEHLFSQTLLHQYGISLFENIEEELQTVNTTHKGAAEFRTLIRNQGQVLGALIVQLNMDYFRRSLDEIKDFFDNTNEYASIYILDETQRIIASSKDSTLEAGKVFPPHLLLDHNLYLKDLQDYYRSKDTPPWKVLFLPKGSAYENIKEYKQNFRYFLIFYLIVAAILGWRIAKKITNPLRKLVESSEKISRGNLEMRITPETTDEIGELAIKFDVMRVNLRDYQNHLKKKILELQTLYQVGTIVSKELDFRTLLKTILDTVVDVMAADKGSILLHDPKTQTLKIAMAKGLKREVIQKTSLAVGESVAGHVFQTQQPMLVMDTTKSPEFHKIKKDQVNPGTMLSVPLISNERPLGVLNISKSMAYSFNDQDLKLFQAIANLCATAIDNARLYKLAITDELTGLFIRRFFFQHLEQLLQTTNRPFSIITLDIDHFKAFNDTHGHSVGDEVLIHVANLLHQAIRDHDIPCRLGGEEFCIICPNQTSRDAEIPANRIRSMIESTPLISASGKELKVTVSLGVCEIGPDRSIQKLYDNADKALYASKDAGRNRVTLYSDIKDLNQE